MNAARGARLIVLARVLMHTRIRPAPARPLERRQPAEHQPVEEAVKTAN